MAGDRRRRRSVEPHRHHRLVDHQRRVGAHRHRNQRATGRRVHAAAGGIVEIGDDIGEARRGLAEGRVHRIDVPAMDRQADRHRHDIGPLQRLDRIMIGGMIDHRPVARPRQPLQQQRETLLRAIGDHDLVGIGRAAAPLIMGGDRPAQHRQAERIIAQIAQIGRQRLDRMGIGEAHAGRGRQRGMGPVEQIVAGHAVDVGRRGLNPAGRQAGDAARPLPAFQIALVAQPVEGGGDGGAAEPQRSGQFPFARQPDIEADPSVQHQHPQRLRQLAIGWLGTVLRAPGAQQPQQRGRPKEGSGHGDQSNQRDLKATYAPLVLL